MQRADRLLLFHFWPLFINSVIFYIYFYNCNMFFIPVVATSNLWHQLSYWLTYYLLYNYIEWCYLILYIIFIALIDGKVTFLVLRIIIYFLIINFIFMLCKYTVYMKDWCLHQLYCFYMSDIFRYLLLLY